jgi:flagellin
MEINNINQLSTLGSTQQNSLEKIPTGLSIDDAKDNTSSLSISNSLKVQRSELSQSLQNLNSGIAATTIASKGIDSQIDILSNMRIKALDAIDETVTQEIKDSIQNELENMIQDYQDIATSTTYAGQSLLINPSGEEQLNIATADNLTTLDIPSTNDIAQEIQTLLSDFSSSGIENIINKIDSSVDQLKNIRDNFGLASTQMQNEAKNTISSEINISKTNLSLKDIDFGTQVTDFSKSNIMTQVGYLVATQANAVQEQSVRLLS